jgi:hypothetical protein
VEHCVFHPKLAAIEHCETCGRALCGQCLWYTEDGHRLCKFHAQELQDQGTPVLPPETYAEAINNSLVARPQPAGGPDEPGAGSQKAPYRGNNQDLSALLAAGIGVITLFSCMGGAYCLPILAALLGVAAYANARQAIDPRRTRILSAVGIGVSGFMLFMVVAYFLLVFGFMAFGFLLSGAP